MHTWGEQQWVKPNHLLTVVNAVCSFDQKGCQRQHILLFWNHTCSRACGLGNLAMARYIRCPGRFCLPANLTPISQPATHICATISPKTFIWLQKPYPIIVDFRGNIHIQARYSESFLYSSQPRLKFRGMDLVGVLGQTSDRIKESIGTL